MLNKSICKKCINGSNFPEYFTGCFEQEGGLKFSWNENDEEGWNKGVVACPLIFEEDFEKARAISTGLLIDGPPPNACPFSLEHLLLENQDETV